MRSAVNHLASPVSLARALLVLALGLAATVSSPNGWPSGCGKAQPLEPLQIFRAVDVPAPIERAPAVSQRNKFSHSGFVDVAPAPGDAAEHERRSTLRADQRIAAVFRRYEHHVAAAGEPARRTPQVACLQRRAVGPDDDRAAVAA